MVHLLIATPSIAGVLPTEAKATPASDDIFDARVAYVLGRLWVGGAGEVTLLGSADDAGTAVGGEVGNLIVNL